MPRRTDAYRETLRSLDDWTPFLLAECGLPGPRGNLELAAAVAEEGSAELFDAFLAYTPKRAPVNSPEEFLAFCGALGQGRLIVEGDTSRFTVLRALAADPRWRTREAVAMALQHVGDHDFDGLLAELERWLGDGHLQRRAVAAALAEPRLLKPERTQRVLHILDEIMARVAGARDRRSAAFLALRKGLGYCWSVVMAADFEHGRPLFEKWAASDDPDVQWVARENLKKKRLQRIDPAWVERWRTRTT
jgi:hypothetical protein